MEHLRQAYTWYKQNQAACGGRDWDGGRDRAPVAGYNNNNNTQNQAGGGGGGGGGAALPWVALPQQPQPQAGLVPLPAGLVPLRAGLVPPVVGGAGALRPAGKAVSISQAPISALPSLSSTEVYSSVAAAARAKASSPPGVEAETGLPVPPPCLDCDAEQQLRLVCAQHMQQGGTLQQQLHEATQEQQDLRQQQQQLERQAQQRQQQQLLQEQQHHIRQQQLELHGQQNLQLQQQQQRQHQLLRQHLQQHPQPELQQSQERPRSFQQQKQLQLQQLLHNIQEQQQLLQRELGAPREAALDSRAVHTAVGFGSQGAAPDLHGMGKTLPMLLQQRAGPQPGAPATAFDLQQLQWLHPASPSSSPRQRVWRVGERDLLRRALMLFGLGRWEQVSGGGGGGEGVGGRIWPVKRSRRWE